MSKCKAVLDGDKITSIAVKVKPSSPTGVPVSPKSLADSTQVSTTPQKPK